MGTKTDLGDLAGDKLKDYLEELMKRENVSDNTRRIVLYMFDNTRLYFVWCCARSDSASRTSFRERASTACPTLSKPRVVPDYPSEPERPEFEKTMRSG